jgi:hypothetical protein
VSSRLRNRATARKNRWRRAARARAAKAATQRAAAEAAPAASPTRGVPAPAAVAEAPAAADAADQDTVAVGAEDAAASAGANSGCSVKLGTIPWAEIWIDGKNTESHTPYSETIRCGNHKLTFIRQDLGVSKTVTINLRPGKTFKQSFSLEEE